MNTINNKDIEKYKPENPIRTFLGINNKQLILALVLLVPSLLVMFSGTQYIEFIAPVSLFLFFYLYIRWRSKTIEDHKAVKIMNIPLKLEHTHEFSLRDSIIFVVVTVLVLIGVGVFAYFSYLL